MSGYTKKCDKCIEAEDGQQAVEIVKASMETGGETIGLVLIDYEMPVMNGAEAVQQMRALGYTGLVVGVTGRVDSDVTDIFITSGANKVLSKPVGMRDLKDLLE